MREYNYKVNARGEDGGRKFWFNSSAGRVTYGDLATSLALMKRSKLATGQSFPRPSQARLCVPLPLLDLLDSTHCQPRFTLLETPFPDPGFCMYVMRSSSKGVCTPDGVQSLQSSSRMLIRDFVEHAPERATHLHR